MDSWISKLENAEVRTALGEYFTKYVDTSLDYCRRNYKTVVPVPAITQAMTICRILEGLLVKVRTISHSMFFCVLLWRYDSSRIYLGDC